jgi:hypothetical protein
VEGYSKAFHLILFLSEFENSSLVACKKLKSSQIVLFDIEFTFPCTWQWHYLFYKKNMAVVLFGKTIH